MLISAYACEPGKGSEPEVGWRWVNEMSKYHDVVVLTRANNRINIENYYDSHLGNKQNIKFEYFDLSTRFLKWKKRLRAHEIYYVCWQKAARKRIDGLLSRDKFDLVHLVTFASFRYPVFLNHLAVPVVWGPVGGAEIAPWSLLWHKFRFTACVKEVARNLATSISTLAVSAINPTRTTGGCVLASTPRTEGVLQRKGIDAMLMPTIGVDVEECIVPDSGCDTNTKGLKLIFVGRLVLLKGVHLLLDALAKADLNHVTLTIVGDGPERSFLEALAGELGIDQQVTFLGQVAKKRLPEQYASHHVVIGPSLYESGGYMVLEGFQQRKPSIVLDVGGLSLSVDESCGIKVPQGSAKAVINGLAEAIRYYDGHPEVVRLHGESGFQKLKKVYAWKEKGILMQEVYRAAVISNRK